MATIMNFSTMGIRGAFILMLVLPGTALAITDPIRSFTQTLVLTTNPDCVVYRTTFWYTNNTPELTDDRLLGVDDVLDCDWNHIMIPADLGAIQLDEQGGITVSPNTEFVTGKELMARQAERIAAEEVFYRTHRWRPVDGKEMNIPVISVREVEQPSNPRH